MLRTVSCVAHQASRSLTAATASLGIVALVFTTGCYTYTMKAPSDLMAGQNVEIVVNNVGRVALTNDLGDDVAKLDGKIVAVTDSVLRVSVNHVDFLNGSETGFPGGTVGIPRNAITSVGTKEFSQSTTTVAAIGIVAALIAVIGVLHATGIGDSNTASKDPGQGPAVQ